MAEPPGLRALLDGARKLREEGRTDEAAALVEEAVARFPDEPLAHLAQARYLREVDAEASREHIDEAVALAPDDPATLVRAAALLLALGELDEAATLVERAAPADADDFPDRDMGLLVEALLARIEHDDEEAERLAREAAAARPDREVHARVLAEILIDHDRLLEALEVVRGALAEHPGERKLQDLLALVVRRLVGGDATVTPSPGGGATSSTGRHPARPRWPLRRRLPSGEVLLIHGRRSNNLWQVSLEGSGEVAFSVSLMDAVADLLELEEWPDWLLALQRDLDRR